MVLVLSQSAEYALRAMVCIAARSGEPARAEDVAVESHVPAAYLSKILRKLVAAKLLHSQKGHHGGFRLARAPSEITYAEILAAIGFDVAADEHCAFGYPRCNTSKPCPLHPAYLELKTQFIHWSRQRTLASPR